VRKEPNSRDAGGVVCICTQKNDCLKPCSDRCPDRYWHPATCCCSASHKCSAGRGIAPAALGRVIGVYSQQRATHMCWDGVE